MKVRVTLTLEPEVIQILDKQASEGSRSRSGQVEWLVKQWWEMRQMQPAPGRVEPREPGTAGAAEFFEADPVTVAREGDET